MTSALRADAAAPPGELLVRDLYEAHGQPLLHTILHWTGGDRHAAEDLLQETMLRAWRNIESLGDKPARPWLLTVARRLAIDAWRSRTARPPEVGDDESIALHGSGQDGYLPDHMETVLDRAVLAPALAGLSNQQREVVFEVYFLRSTLRQTAKTLGVPEGTVKTRARSALRDLRAHLGEESAQVRGRHSAPAER